MELTIDEKRLIVSALENNYRGLPDEIAKAAEGSAIGLVYTGEIAQRMGGKIKVYRMLLSVEKKIFESLPEDEDAPGALGETNDRIEALAELEDMIVFSENDEQPETDDSDGVLGDKAQD